MLQRVIVVILVVNVSTFTVNQMAYQRDCVDLECERTTFEKSITHLSDSNGTIEQCRGCQQCTINGYSVCVRLRENALRARRAPDETIGVCGCSHMIPTTCNTRPTRQKPLNESTKLFNICYLSALQSPPHPEAENRQASIIVTIEPFWLQPYWKELRLSNLTLHYEFPVTVPENCDGDIIQAAVDGHSIVCSANLQIEMGEPETITDEGNNEDQQSDNYYDDDGFSEVQFDRAVFAGAGHVKFWYMVEVQRPRQLNVRSSDNAIIDVNTIINSDSLEFDLETSKYGFGDSEEIEPSNIAKEKEEANKDAHNGDGGTPIVTSKDDGSYPEQALREKTAEEVAREVDFFAADDEARPIPGDEERDPVVPETDPGDDLNTDTDFDGDAEEKLSNTGPAVDREEDRIYGELDEELDKLVDDTQTYDQVDATTVEVIGSNEERVKTNHLDLEANEKSNEKDEQNDGRRNEGKSTGNVLNEFDNNILVGSEEEEDREVEEMERRTDDWVDELGVERSTHSTMAIADSEDKEETLSNGEDSKEDVEVAPAVLQQDKEFEYRPWMRTTSVMRTTPGTESAKKETEGEIHEDEGDEIQLHDDTSAVPNSHKMPSTSNFNDKQIGILTTPASVDSTTDNNPVISNGTKTVFHEFFNNFGIKHVSIAVYILGLAILACLLLLCLLCCIRKREKVFACCKGNSGRRNKNTGSNGVNGSYKYTAANTQSMNVHPEREKLNQ